MPISITAPEIPIGNGSQLSQARWTRKVRRHRSGWAIKAYREEVLPGIYVRMRGGGGERTCGDGGLVAMHEVAAALAGAQAAAGVERALHTQPPLRIRRLVVTPARMMSQTRARCGTRQWWMDDYTKVAAHANMRLTVDLFASFKLSGSAAMFGFVRHDRV